MSEIYYDDDEPLWKRIFLNEILWAVLVILGLLFVAFHFATAPDPDAKETGLFPTEQQAHQVGRDHSRQNINAPL